MSVPLYECQMTCINTETTEVQKPRNASPLRCRRIQRNKSKMQ